MQTVTKSVADLEGAEPAPAPPLGDPPLGDGPTVTENGTVSCDASMIICLSLSKTSCEDGSYTRLK